MPTTEVLALLKGKLTADQMCDARYQYREINEAIQQWCIPLKLPPTLPVLVIQRDLPDLPEPRYLHSAPMLWNYREAARMQFGIYPAATEILDKINTTFPWIHAHVSLEDPTLVAYTPDRNMGEQDRQLKISLGKLLFKLWPYLSDNVVADMVAAHNAELTEDFETLEGQAIVDFYKTERNSIPDAVRGCMCYPSDYWYKGVHPAEVYDAPQIKMAVLRDKYGRISARSLIVEVEGEKRYIRTYGDRTKLTKMLHRKGYVKGGWVGVVFNHSKGTFDEEGRLCINIPYLDSMDGHATAKYSSVAFLDGKLQGISLEVANALGYYKMSVGHNSSHRTVHMTFVPSLSSDLEAVCPLTGTKYSNLDATIRLVKYIKDGERMDVPYKFLPEGVIELKGGVYTNDPVFEYAGYSYLDTELERSRIGQVKLCPITYPDEANTWVSRYDTHMIDGVRYKAKDCVNIFDVSDFMYFHKSKVPDLKKVTPVAGTKFVSARTDTYKTPSGRTVAIGLHAVALLPDGTVDFTRNLQRIRVLGATYWVPKLDCLAKWHKVCAEKGMQHVVDVGLSVRNKLSNNVACNYRALSGEYLNVIRSKESLSLIFKAMAASYSGDADFDFLKSYYERWEAETNALDYSVSGVQGSADGLWTAPPELPDSDGLLDADKLALADAFGRDWMDGSFSCISDYSDFDGFYAAFMAAFDDNIWPTSVADVADLRVKYSNIITKIYLD